MSKTGISDGGATQRPNWLFFLRHHCTLAVLLELTWQKSYDAIKCRQGCNLPLALSQTGASRRCAKTLTNSSVLLADGSHAHPRLKILTALIPCQTRKGGAYNYELHPSAVYAREALT